MSELVDLPGWEVLIAQHLRQYPAMTAQDVYKLIYQGVLGPEHLMPSPEAFTAVLQAELAGLQAGRGEALLEPVRPDGALSRINLRAWLSLGRPLDDLTAECLSAGRRAWGTPAGLRQVWAHFTALARRGDFPAIVPAQVAALQAQLEAAGFPALHHSKIYTGRYQPAYRLVAHYA